MDKCFLLSNRVLGLKVGCRNLKSIRIPQESQKLVKVNLESVLFLNREVLPRLIRSKPSIQFKNPL